MGTEIERKFLVVSAAWRAGATPTPIRQGYLCAGPSHVVRVRTFGERAFFTVKSGGAGLTRLEFEYEIPRPDATVLLDALCLRPLIEKTRFTVDVAGTAWVVDVFSGDNAGLALAEVELEAEDQAVVLPPWVGQEVTGDPRYFNAALRERPYATWPAEERATAAAS
ncbi:MAG: CYTH domain-containing protein [Rhodospirillales bacterium]